MKIYNTLSGKKEELATVKPSQVNIYVCGPTTYNYIHLGNARPMVVFDTVRRYLQYCGNKVNYVQNFTDVDDKIIDRAREEGLSPMELGQKYIDEYFLDADALNILRADAHPQVSQHIPEIVTAIQKLIDKGYAYAVDGDVFYRVQAFADYGKLSGRSLEDMLAGARVGVDERKEAAVDFALWKTAKEGEPSWDSPWGPGRPGWHIECSVMATKYLGNTLDIHGGGSDLIFPHHENEIAQAEALTEQEFVRYWMHNGFITVNNEKMSKSLGNFFILRDILAEYPADAVRFYLISTHYRSPLDFDDSKLEEARKALTRLKTTLLLVQEFTDEKNFQTFEFTGGAREHLNSISSLEQSFLAAMDDDFNTAKAIGFLFEMAHQINSYIAEADKQIQQEQAVVKITGATFKNLGDIMGIFMDSSRGEGGLVDKMLEIIVNLRHDARINKNYQLADNLRDYLNSLGVKIEDGSGGSKIRYEKEPEFNGIMAKLIDVRNALKQNRNYKEADNIRETLSDNGIIIEDTREGVRWKFADA